jgi:rubrerythrin
MKGEMNMGVLTTRQEKLLVLFKNAVERESEAQKAYSEMLPLNDDPAIRRIIETFIEQEKQHEETLLRMYNELRTTGEFKDAT